MISLFVWLFSFSLTIWELLSDEKEWIKSDTKLF